MKRKSIKLGLTLLCSILLVSCGESQVNSTNSSLRNSSSSSYSDESSSKQSSSTHTQESSSSSKQESSSSSSSSLTVDTPTLPEIDEATTEKLQACFDQANLIPEIITNNIKLPITFKGISNQITWNITRGNEYLNLDSNILMLKNNPNDISSVCEITAAVSGTDFTYTYHSITHIENNHDLPIFDIHTVNNVFPEDKETYIDGDISVIDYQNDTYSIDLVNASMGIRLRGNSTMPANKKPFRIKFNEKQSLFGLTKAKSWVLLANFYDKSNLRNYLAYTMANQMDYLDFQPSSIFVEVCFNGEFLGLYLLSEQMQSGKGRVDIEDDIDEVTGMPSYFIELNSRAADPEENLIPNVEFFISCRGVFEYKYPEPNDDNTLNPGVNDYIVNYIYETNEAIQNGNYEDYIDVDSFIDYYIVEELFKNVDVADTSQYYVKYANGKLKMGPVWDFDISLGVIDYPEYWANKLHVRTRDIWYNYLFNDPVFLQKVKERYTAIRHTYIDDVLNHFSDIIVKLDKAQQANLQRWPLEYDTGHGWFIEEHYNESYKNINSLQGHYVYLELQLTNQMDVLDSYYLITE